ncbi:hypothetical protein BBM70_10160 [Vibrio parahaemolyticus]|uniref:hypothetical protein n=1 Tax=Vibrio parahaemolyticus TaxID=670 RepID=UPI00084AE07F|nr:hypothetical protein [Vibrio parahaemolyticus]OEA87395.1 hypothetical protein BBM70_10160 [Vibrio parahaemolyticus]
MTKSLLTLTALSALTLVGCSESEPEFSVNQITVSDFAYTMNEQPAVSITFGKDNNNFCDVTLYRDDIVQGFSSTLENKSSGNLSSSCTWNKAYYVQSSKHPTLASLTIDKLDKVNQTANIKASLKLVNSKTLDDFFEIDDVEIKVSGEQFMNLITKPEE